MAQIYLSPAASMRPAVRGPAVHQGVRLQRVSVLSPPKEAAFRGIGNSVGRLRAVEQYANGSSVGEGLIPSPVSEVHSLKDFQKLVDENKDRLFVLKCKAKGCRPCKAFVKKYLRIAAEHSDVEFAEITGDETMETRRLMMHMNVKTTPTFLMFTNGELVHQMSGANKEKLTAAILDHNPREYDSSVTDTQLVEGGLQMKLQGA